ncbi:hypothetical protein TELCIR_07743 [Teladorsagia circumcincta]|uniref:Uncharacterized protein n=1 Tax=Teladorsagia circumcincta TaxID=45464 RepID=A0A2G9UL02_TELCI|nr:hypothetical protein TELCIR_07743 [Teladorsagia circumcincta]
MLVSRIRNVFKQRILDRNNELFGCHNTLKVLKGLTRSSYRLYHLAKPPGFQVKIESMAHSKRGTMKVHSDTTAPDKEPMNPIRRYVERKLIGNFDSADFSEAWKQKFSHAPTWCDADMSLQQINRISKRDVGDDDAIDPEVRRGPDLPLNQDTVNINNMNFDYTVGLSTYFKEMDSERYLLQATQSKTQQWTLMNSLLDKMIPCIWITPIDCYWEGSKPLGPDPPINLGEEISGFVTSLPKGNVSWKNLNPTAVMAEAGIGAAYTDRPCIEPLDPECPKTSPNYFDRCTAMEKFNEWNMAKPDSEKIQLERKPYQEKKEERDSAAQLTETIINDIFGKNCSHYYDIFEPGRKKREATGTRVTTGPPKPSVKDEDYYAYEDSDYDVTITNASCELVL